LVPGLAVDAWGAIKLAEEPNDRLSQGVLVTGLSLTAVGVLFWAVSALSDEPSQWRFKITGKAVKTPSVADRGPPRASSPVSRSLLERSDDSLVLERCAAANAR
jgi:hypothetical protein